MTDAASLLTIARRLGGGALDLILPPRCLACGGEIDAPYGLCPPCWSELRLLAPGWAHVRTERLAVPGLDADRYLVVLKRSV